jgi:hypothetical protein
MVKETSLEAYISEQPKIESQVQQLKNFFSRYSALSFSDADLQKVFHWKANVVWSRRSQLVRDGWIIPVGVTINGNTGRRVTTYKWKEFTPK